jgi:hypothetical protein
VIITACSDDEDAKFKGGSIVISDFYPKTALPGTEVTIIGGDFGNSGKVYFNEAEATDIVSYTHDKIVVKVPENAASGRIGIVSGSEYGFSEDEFTFIPGAVITSLSYEKAPVGEQISIYGKNFHQLSIDQIEVCFNNVRAEVLTATSTEINVIIPDGATSGPLTVKFGDIETVTWDSFTIGAKPIVVDDIVLDLWDYVTTGGNITVDPKPSNGIGSTKNGAWVLYKFTVPADAKYDVHALCSTNQSYNCYVNIDLGIDEDELSDRVVNSDLSQQLVKEGWATMRDYEYGTFELRAGVTYYLRAYFLAEGTSWVGNISEIRIVLAPDQDVDAIDVEAATLGYKLYSCNFNEGSSYAPFTPSWAWDPNYIKVVDQCLEFYYNQAALDADNRRERRGCEVTCPFSTTSEGWYGFKIYLPDGSFPKNVDNSVIAQIFNNGSSNTWAGHLKISQNKLLVAYRNAGATTAEVDKEVGTVSWGKWIPIVMYFKAGKNNKGNIKVWLGDNMSENNPTFDSGNINLAWGDWIDDNTLDGSTTTLGGKWGLYVSSGGDRIIRFDDLKALVGNPDGAFSLVAPK